ncbi:substrate-binding domain-containing protein [Candidatus Parabeggiatoa sp. HSG14]|uniref:substrate-binding domain-containing protein n=1 Tax=Candidatus Parabeggiatoa sp. HSG14 TaxID=3055593 RepID=UPI0025A8E6A0|nr:substrate-binding domain-containing protein [Thiotrichales bacterium HSG14]
MKKTNQYLWFIGHIGLSMFILPNVWSMDELVAGKAFTKFSQIIEMPEKWRKQPIQYKNWAKGSDLAITLDQQLYPALLPVIQKYAKQNKLDIAVQEGTCGTSAKGLKDKIADIAGFCCPPSEADRLSGIKFHTLGIASLALLVNSKNPINKLSLKQARQIFQGHIFRWSSIKNKGKRGPRRIIQVFGRLHCKQRPGHWRLLLDNEDLFSPRMSELSTIPDMVSEVALNRYGISYETLMMLKHYSNSRKVKTLSIDHIAPTDNAKLIAGEYPLYRTYNVTTWESQTTKNRQAQALVKYLIDYMEKLDPSYGIVPVSKLRKAGWQFMENEIIGEPH